MNKPELLLFYFCKKCCCAFISVGFFMHDAKQGIVHCHGDGYFPIPGEIEGRLNVFIPSTLH